MNWISDNWDNVAAAVAAAFVITRFVVALTSTKADDDVVAKVEDFFKRFIGPSGK